MTDPTPASSGLGALRHRLGEPTPWAWALAWLAVPLIVYAVSWMRPEAGLPLAAAWVLALALLRREPVRGAVVEAIVGIAGALAVLGLIGFATGIYNADWIKHWALLHVMGEGEWPAHHAFRDTDLNLRYYVGAYIAPALLFKAWPALTVRWATALCFGIGIALFIGAFLRSDPEPRAGRRASAAVMALLLAGGDFLGEYAMRLSRDLPVNGGWLHTEWWYAHATGHALQFPSMVAALTWAPNQTLATGVVALMWAFLPAERGLRAPLLGYAALSLWSPFGMAGLLPLVAARCWERREVLRDPVTGAMAGLAALTTWAVAWILSTDSPPVGLRLVGIADHLLDYPSAVPFLLVELGPAAWILRERLWRDRVLLACLATLMAIPVLETIPPDLVLRSSVGPLVVLFAAAGREAVRRVSVGDWAAPALALLVCLPTVVTEVGVHLTHGRAYESLAKDDPSQDTYLRQFQAGDEGTVEHLLDATGWRYKPNYFSGPPVLLREPAHRRPPAAAPRAASAADKLAAASMPDIPPAASGAH